MHMASRAKAGGAPSDREAGLRAAERNQPALPAAPGFAAASGGGNDVAQAGAPHLCASSLLTDRGGRLRGREANGCKPGPAWLPSNLLQGAAGAGLYLGAPPGASGMFIQASGMAAGKVSLQSNGIAGAEAARCMVNRRQCNR